jgi:phospholipid/cholesterol/gamma-HCH transport system substrate-binding protein
MMQNEIPQITNRLTTITDNFATVSGNLKTIDYSTTFSKIDSTLYNVQLLTNKLNSKDNTVGLLFNDPTLYNNLSTTTANAASLLEDLQAHPKRYVHFSIFGRKEK